MSTGKGPRALAKFAQRRRSLWPQSPRKGACLNAALGAAGRELQMTPPVHTAGATGVTGLLVIRRDP